jgi:hypothetical protein
VTLVLTAAYLLALAGCTGRGDSEAERSQLVFSRHWIEDERTGNFYREFGGDPAYASHVSFYYTTESGLPVMLEPCTNPASRADLEQRQARKEQRRIEQEAATRQR